MVQTTHTNEQRTSDGGSMSITARAESLVKMNVQYRSLWLCNCLAQAAQASLGAYCLLERLLTCFAAAALFGTFSAMSLRFTPTSHQTGPNTSEPGPNPTEPDRSYTTDCPTLTPLYRYVQSDSIPPPKPLLRHSLHAPPSLSQLLPPAGPSSRRLRL